MFILKSVIKNITWQYLLIYSTGIDHPFEGTGLRARDGKMQKRAVLALRKLARASEHFFFKGRGSKY